MAALPHGGEAAVWASVLPRLRERLRERDIELFSEVKYRTILDDGTRYEEFMDGVGVHLKSELVCGILLIDETEKHNSAEQGIVDALLSRAAREQRLVATRAALDIAHEEGWEDLLANGFARTLLAPQATEMRIRPNGKIRGNGVAPKPEAFIRMTVSMLQADGRLTHLRPMSLNLLLLSHNLLINRSGPDDSPEHVVQGQANSQLGLAIARSCDVQVEFRELDRGVLHELTNQVFASHRRLRQRRADDLPESKTTAYRKFCEETFFDVKQALGKGASKAAVAREQSLRWRTYPATKKGAYFPPSIVVFHKDKTQWTPEEYLLDKMFPNMDAHGHPETPGLFRRGPLVDWAGAAFSETPWRDRDPAGVLDVALDILVKERLVASHGVDRWEVSEKGLYLRLWDSTPAPVSGDPEGESFGPELLWSDAEDSVVTSTRSEEGEVRPEPAAPPPLEPPSESSSGSLALLCALLDDTGRRRNAAVPGSLADGVCRFVAMAPPEEMAEVTALTVLLVARAADEPLLPLLWDSLKLLTPVRGLAETALVPRALEVVAVAMIAPPGQLLAVLLRSCATEPATEEALNTVIAHAARVLGVSLPLFEADVREPWDKEWLTINAGPRRRTTGAERRQNEGEANEEMGWTPLAEGEAPVVSQIARAAAYLPEAPPVHQAIAGYAPGAPSAQNSAKAGARPVSRETAIQVASPWTSAENEVLWQHIREVGRWHWKTVADRLGRTEQSVKNHLLLLEQNGVAIPDGPVAHARRWSPAEDDTLRTQSLGARNWQSSAELTGRSVDAVRRRFGRVNRRDDGTVTIESRRWSREQDVTLKDFVTKHGLRRWDEAAEVTGHSAEGARSRYKRIQARSQVNDARAVRGERALPPEPTPEEEEEEVPE